VAPNPYGYRCDLALWKPGDGPADQLRNRLRLLYRALRDFDIVHFNFGSSFLPKRAVIAFLDLALLKRAGKIVFVTYQGDDARLADFCRRNFEISIAGELGSAYYSAAGERIKRRGIRAFDRYADGIYALNPDLLHMLPRRTRFVPYASVDLRAWNPAVHASAARPSVVHAPSHRGAKGTRYILDAVSRLQSEGVPFDFLLVEGQSRDQARRVYEKADLLIDQLLAGWYGGLAAELMALGKPVIAYLREGDLGFIDPEMRAALPIIRADPGSIYEVLKRCLTADRQLLPGIGARSRDFVVRWHDPVRIARFFKAEYEAAIARRQGARGVVEI